MNKIIYNLLILLLMIPSMLDASNQDELIVGKKYKCISYDFAKIDGDVSRVIANIDQIDVKTLLIDSPDETYAKFMGIEYEWSAHHNTFSIFTDKNGDHLNLDHLGLHTDTNLFKYSISTKDGFYLCVPDCGSEE